MTLERLDSLGLALGLHLLAHLLVEAASFAHVLWQRRVVERLGVRRRWQCARLC